MEKTKRQWFAVLMTTVLLAMLFRLPVWAEDTYENRVHVIVENTTYGMAAGAPWEGRRIETWVTIDETSTALTVLEEAVGSAGNLDVQTGAYGEYINGILGIAAGDGGSVGAYGYNPAGWMYTINNTMASFGIGQCSVAAGTLSGGDELAFLYSLDGGPDIGYDWSDTTSKALRSLTVSTGVLSPAFSSGVTDYTLTVPVETESILVTADAENLGETITMWVGEQEYKRAMNIPVSTGTRLELRCSNGTEETVYSIYVKKAEDLDATAIYEDVLQVVSSGLTEETCIYGNEWAVMTAARAGVLKQEQADAYCRNLEAAVKEFGSGTLDSRYATTNARVILALSAMGKNPREIGGYDLLQPLGNMDYIAGQGVNAAIYALLALDANQYEIPAASDGAAQTTREGLVQMILDAECAGGGWAWSGDYGEPDLTANALQALTPYYNTNPSVKEAVDRGLQTLSAIQEPDGSFSSWGTENTCSTAQVLTALTGLGIDPATDSRFIKNGYTVINALDDFYVSGSGFRYDFSSSDIDIPFSTIQGAYSLVAYQRFTKGQNRLYDMSDAFLNQAAEEASASTTASGNDKSPATGDSAPVAIWFGLAMAAMAGGAGMLRRNQH
ncbi:MAG: DUF4430 domain-containing protein [Bacteroides sp.]|nr:DUF4430 domain-containing protein [Bacteroides sp.]MCM1549564.1 DUF4430 domain-containing protein [Clostridium sp.]